MSNKLTRLFCIGALLILSIMPLGCDRQITPTPYPLEPHECCEECGDFCLIISVSSTRLRRGNNIEVTAVFRNLSNESFEVSRGHSLIIRYIAGFYNEGHIGIGVFDYIKEYEKRVSTWNIGGKLSRGSHDLKAFSRFGIIYEWDKFGDPLLPNAEQNVRLASNIITLTVV